MSGSVLIFGEICICQASFVRYGIWSVAKCYDSIVLPYVSLAVMLFDIITGAIVGVA